MGNRVVWNLFLTIGRATGTAIDPTVEADLLTGGGGFVNEPRLIVAVPPGTPSIETITENGIILEQRKIFSGVYVSRGNEMALKSLGC